MKMICVPHSCHLSEQMFKKLKLAPSPTCSCGLEDQTPDLVLQNCSLLKDQRDKTWPTVTPLSSKLYGNWQDLEDTASFVSLLGLTLWRADDKKKKKLVANSSGCARTGCMVRVSVASLVMTCVVNCDGRTRATDHTMMHAWFTLHGGQCFSFISFLLSRCVVEVVYI
jgi:hypothetical protein